MVEMYKKLEAMMNGVRSHMSELQYDMEAVKRIMEEIEAMIEDIRYNENDKQQRCKEDKGTD